MASVVYDFAFGLNCAGLDAAVVDAAGDAVADSPVTLDSNGASQLTLAEGRYTATTSDPTPDGQNSLSVVGVLNVPASIEAAALLPEVV